MQTTQIYETSLIHFRYGRPIINTPVNVTWWHLDENDDARGFTPQEIQQFENFISANHFNFEGIKNVFIASEGAEPYIDELDIDVVQRPSLLLLRKTPELGHLVLSSMEIVLTDSLGNDKTTDDLPFDVIAVIR